MDIPLIIEMAKASDRIVYQNICVIDISSGEFIYLPDGIDRLCGCKVDRSEGAKVAEYLKLVKPGEIDMLRTVCDRARGFISSLPQERRQNCSLSVNLHVGKAESYTMVNVKCTPLTLTTDGGIRYVAASVSLADSSDAGTAIIRETDGVRYYEYSAAEGSWTEQKEIWLSTRERIVLSLSARGYTIEKIAKKMCISKDSVKLYRHNLYDKLEASNMTEAVVIAQNNNLI